MSRQVLGKRSHSSFSSPSPSRSYTPASKSRRVSVALEPPSPDPTPKSKRVKTTPTGGGEDDGSNKENIPPEAIPGSPGRVPSPPSDSTSATAAMTPRELRASRRASAQETVSTPTSPRSMSSSNPRSAAASSSRRSSASPPISRKATQLRAGMETPSKTMARLSLSTPPSTPTCLLPSPLTTENTATKPLSLHTVARALLRPQAHSDAPLVGREHERTQILEFLSPFLASKSRTSDTTSLYISGAPGTGKTALVNEVLTSVSASGDSDAMDVDDASLRVVYVNCMSVGAKDGMTGVWERCVEELGAEKKKRGSANKMEWSERFASLLRGRKCVLVLDEIDHLTTSTAGTISASQVFALACTPQTRTSLRIIGISNTHTLTHTMASDHTQIIHFEPYTAGQMKAVLSLRLASLQTDSSNAAKLFPIPTIALLTMKIASQTGDIRTVFSVARRALDLAAAASEAAVTVTPAHVLAALKASNASTSTSQGKGGGAEIVTRVRNLGLHARFALAALLLAAKRVTAGLALTGSASNRSSGKLKENAPSSVPSAQGRDAAAPVIDVTTLHGFYVMLLSRADSAFHSVGRTEFGDLLNLLEGSGLVELTHGRGFGNKAKGAPKGKGTLLACIARGMREDELVRGLTGSVGGASAEGETVDVQEEEVKRIWEREVGRLGREVKAKFGDALKKADFDGAEED